MTAIAVRIKSDVSVGNALLLENIHGFLLSVVRVCGFGVDTQDIDTFVLIGISKFLKHWHLLNAASTAIEPEGQNSDLILSKNGVVIGSASSDICCLKIWEGIAVFEVQF